MTVTTRNHNRKLTHFSPLAWVMGRRKVPQPQCRIICLSWPSSGSCSLFPLGQFHQGDRFCPIVMDRRARMVCHLRHGCTDSLQSSVSKCQDMSSPAKHCPCLLIHQSENTEKEEMYLLKEQYQPTNWHSDRTYTEYISVRNLLTPRQWDFAVSSIRFSQSKCFAILPKKRGWHLEGMTPSGLWDNSNET